MWKTLLACACMIHVHACTCIIHACTCGVHMPSNSWSPACHHDIKLTLRTLTCSCLHPTCGGLHCMCSDYSALTSQCPPHLKGLWWDNHKVTSPSQGMMVSSLCGNFNGTGNVIINLQISSCLHWSLCG